MDKLWWRAAWGLCLVPLSLAQIDLNITCRYAGVYHVEKNGRYSISLTEAADLCKAFNSTLPTMEQMEKARSIGFETCRYGFIQGHVVIPRINPNSICAANNTGVYILTSNTSQYDTYCFNASAPEDEEDCTSVTDLPNSFDGVITITIVNRDGTRYTKKGEYRTNPEDINPSNPSDDDVSSGSSIDRSTSVSNIFYMSFPTKDPTPDLTSRWGPDTTDSAPATIPSTARLHSHATTKEQSSQLWSWFGNSQPGTQDVATAATTGTDSDTRSAGPEPHEENEDERDNPPSFSGSGIDDDEDFISNTTSAHDSHTNQRVTTSNPEDSSSWMDFLDPISHPMGRGHQTGRTTDMESSHSPTLQPTEDPDSGLVDDLDRAGPLSMTTPSNDDRGGARGENLPEDSAPSVESYTPRSPDPEANRTLTSVTPAMTQPPGVNEVAVIGDSNSDVGHLLPEHRDEGTGGRSHTTHGSESDGQSSGNQGDDTSTTLPPVRKAQIPEWLIILASLLALALILAVCIAVNSRRRCGQKKKLVINGNGAVENRKPSELNGEASKSQEMVHLVNKEPSATPDQCMTADETRNLQNVDMKIGV
ncbi:CD44 antigen isoform X2 [Echinops telfairi]|uniref:CD44 antigen isoform X2 n=1 Tax=Echinops telfairi TaxID=9371 RepID=A0AC55D4X6_ECHTE|nr:CD44 antigen isoform X2 [Echinops telfairi]